MPLPQLESARYARLDQDGSELPTSSLVGRETLILHFANGEEAAIDLDQKGLAVGINGVFLGITDFADEVLTVTHPENGSEIQLRGYTDDAQIVNLTQDFLIAVEKRTFKPGPVELPK